MRIAELYPDLKEYAFADYVDPETKDSTPLYLNPTKSEFQKLMRASRGFGVRAFILGNEDIVMWEASLVHVTMLRFLLKIRAYSQKELSRGNIIGILVDGAPGDYIVEVLDWGLGSTDETEYYLRNNDYLYGLLGDFELRIEPESSRPTY